MYVKVVPVMAVKVGTAPMVAAAVAVYITLTKYLQGIKRKKEVDRHEVK